MDNKTRKALNDFFGGTDPVTSLSDMRKKSDDEQVHIWTHMPEDILSMAVSVLCEMDAKND